MATHIKIVLLLVLSAFGLRAQETSILGSFDAAAFNGKVQLSWQITAGSVCDGIKISHSTDSINFTQIGEIIGVCGSISEPVNYSFTHDTPLQNGKNYYRLQLGATGKSPIININLITIGNSGYQIRPHPVNGPAMVYFTNENQQPHTLVVYNSNGQQVQKYYTSTGSFNIQPTGITNGMYLFTIADEKENIKLRGKLLLLQ
ncbi:MAG: T9SS type A sorting domain-containing protein [Sphingobacteriales bacterium JAD_PAG50586_3]|nr:MAG: T9SS type A sorting domain-containing protein [Sphingobacteriales bacterium JAD_PAG50586_3]